MTDTAPDALLFDFDGLILDTETTTYETVAATFEAYGATLDIAWWRSILGTADHPHWTEHLAETIGRPVDRESLVAQREAHRRPLIEALPACDGVEALLDAADAAHVPAAVASSSAADWVVPHLERLGLAGRFRAIVTRDDVDGDATRTKPAPDLYRIAATRLGADSARCVVLEDSPNGVAAGRAAGMRVVAVPSPLTRPLDFSAAHLVVDSIAALDIATLGALVRTP